MASRADHHNSVLRRSTARALELEPKLARILEPILAGAGDEAATNFEAHATNYLTAAGLPAPTPVYDTAAVATPGVTALSTMVALKPRPDEAARLEHQQIPADELHCTLCYLGEVDMPLERLQGVLAAVAASHAPLEGSVAGIAAFAAGDNGHPSIVLPSVPGLVELRVAVAQALAEAGIDFSRAYGFVPHMTVMYSDQSEGAIAFPSVDSFGQPLHFDAIHIVRGGTEHIELPLTGGTPITAAAGAGDDVARRVGEVGARYGEASAPDYGDVWWNEESRTVYWITADYTGNEALEGGMADFHAIDGVDEVIDCDECGPPDEDGWRLVYDNSGGGKIVAALTADAKWAAPVGDELVDVDALVKKLRTKTDPVRLAVIETAMTAALEGVGLEWDATNPFTAKVLAQSGSQITNIAKSTQLNVMRIIRASYDEGLSIRDTAKAIRSGMKEASVVRSLLIARTELAGAVNGGAVASTQIVSEATGIGFEKTWKTAEGAHFPRHEEYDGLDGQTVGLDDYFDVGGSQLAFPGDPDGPPEDVCNCRCAVIFVEAGVEVGEEQAA